jgi:hypothetical protein
VSVHASVYHVLSMLEEEGDAGSDSCSCEEYRRRICWVEEIDMGTLEIAYHDPTDPVQWSSV